MVQDTGINIDFNINLSYGKNCLWRQLTDVVGYGQ